MKQANQKDSNGFYLPVMNLNFRKHIGIKRNESVRTRLHKFNATRSKCHEGHHHPSKIEAAYCNDLRALVKAKEIYCYEYERRFALEVHGDLICHHKPDFCVYKTKDDYEVDHFEIHEVKGAQTADWNIRRKLFEACFPYNEYIVIKARRKQYGN